MARPALPDMPWICDLGNDEFDHDWEHIADWGGDPEVVGGTFNCDFWRCRVCGEEDPDGNTHPKERKAPSGKLAEQDQAGTNTGTEGANRF